MKQGEHLPEEAQKLLRKLAVRNPRPTNKEIRAEINRKCGVALSDRTIGRYCKELELPISSRRPTLKAGVSQSDAGVSQSDAIVIAQRRKEHWDKLRILAEKFKSNIETLLNNDVSRDGKLDTESEYLFPSLLIHLRAEYKVFNEFDSWKEEVKKCIVRRHRLADDIRQSIKTVSIPDGFIADEFSDFIYEYIMMNDIYEPIEDTVRIEFKEKSYVGDYEQSVMTAFETEKMALLVEKKSGIVLARHYGSNIKLLEKCKKVLSQKAKKFSSEAKSLRIQERHIFREESEKFLSCLDLVIERGEFKNTSECPICRGWDAK